MKKSIVIILAILLALSLAACANPQNGGDSTDPQGSYSPAGNVSGSDGTSADADTEPSENFTHETPIRILVHSGASRDIWGNDSPSGTLSAAMTERDAAIGAMWSSAPEYTLSNINFQPQAMAGFDNYDICLFRLSDAINYASGGLALDVSGHIPHPENAAWEQGLWSLTFMGKTLFAAPSVSVNGNDRTYAVFYDAGADGGALKDKVESVDGWTWEQMLAMKTESPQLANNGMYWGERTLSAMLIAGGFRLDPDSFDPAEMYMEPIIDYAASGKVLIPSILDGSPFKSSDRVFTVGQLDWLYDRENQTVYDRVTVLPMPRQSMEQTENRTASFFISCMFVPSPAEGWQEDCTDAMYVFAKATYDKMRTPYLDQLVPASNAVSRANVEKLLTSRVYDYVLHSNDTWTTQNAKQVKSFIAKNRVEYLRASDKWADFYTQTTD